nr:cation-chloride cotransporter 1 [Tanacetum cinerariifolium]
MVKVDCIVGVCAGPFSWGLVVGGKGACPAYLMRIFQRGTIRRGRSPFTWLKKARIMIRGNTALHIAAHKNLGSGESVEMQKMLKAGKNQHKYCKIQVSVIAKEDSAAEKLKANVRKFHYDPQMQAEVVVISMRTWEHTCHNSGGITSWKS